MNGDDAAGILVVRALRQLLPPQENLLLVEGGAAPENFTAPLRRFAPARVILVDAARMHSSPGTIAWVQVTDALSGGPSTHTLSPSALSDYLVHELGCRVDLLAIQAESAEFGTQPSPGVLQGVQKAIRELQHTLAADHGLGYA